MSKNIINPILFDKHPAINFELKEFKEQSVINKYAKINIEKHARTFFNMNYEIIGDRKIRITK